MQVMGVEQELQLEVSEPEPGRVLVERDQAAGILTTFTVDPMEDGKSSRVTIATQAKASPGLRGWIEKLVNPVIVRRIYKEELQQLADYVHTKMHPQ
jgi:dephospho-CoA kinase